MTAKHKAKPKKPTLSQYVAGINEAFAQAGPWGVAVHYDVRVSGGQASLTVTVGRKDPTATQFDLGDVSGAMERVRIMTINRITAIIKQIDKLYLDTTILDQKFASVFNEVTNHNSTFSAIRDTHKQLVRFATVLDKSFECKVNFIR